MAGIGHNRGPSLEQAGAGFRRVAWGRARAQLLPALPLEVVRLRVARAERLGLPYRTYATIRAVSGRDIVGFLFSSNALDLRGAPQLPEPVRQRLRALEGGAARLGAIHAPIPPGAVFAGGDLDAAERAPGLLDPWRRSRDALRALARAGRVPPDGVVVVAATSIERDWCEMAGFGGVLGRGQLFGT